MSFYTRQNPNQIETESITSHSTMTSPKTPSIQITFLDDRYHQTAEESRRESQQSRKQRKSRNYDTKNLTEKIAEYGTDGETDDICCLCFCLCCYKREDMPYDYDNTCCCIVIEDMESVTESPFYCECCEICKCCCAVLSCKCHFSCCECRMCRLCKNVSCEKCEAQRCQCCDCEGPFCCISHCIKFLGFLVCFDKCAEMCCDIEEER